MTIAIGTTGDVQDLKHRVTSLVAKVASMRGDFAKSSQSVLIRLSHTAPK